LLAELYFLQRNETLPDKEFYETKIPKRISDFFNRFLVCSKQVDVKDQAEMKRIVDVVYSVGEASENIIERMISMYVDDNNMDIVGPEDVIKEISQKIGATICDKET